MTVREWIGARTPRPPAALVEQILDVLGPDADADAAQTADVCLAAAARGLDGILSAGRFARDSALELLAIDALTTYAYEHASEAGCNERGLRELSERGAHMLGQLLSQRV